MKLTGPDHAYLLDPICGQPFAFIPDPQIRGRWVRTDPSVLIVGCPACGVDIGKPCLSDSNKTWAGTHADRRRAAIGGTTTFSSTATYAVHIDSLTNEKELDIYKYEDED